MEYQWLHAEIQGQFEDHLSKYTDGSTDQGSICGETFIDSDLEGPSDP